MVLRLSMSLMHPKSLAWFFLVCQGNMEVLGISMHFSLHWTNIDPTFTLNPNQTESLQSAKQNPICGRQCHTTPVTGGAGAWESRANSGAQMAHDFVHHSICGPKPLNSVQIGQEPPNFIPCVGPRMPTSKIQFCFHMLFVQDTNIDASPISTCPKCRPKVLLPNSNGDRKLDSNQKEHNYNQNTESYPHSLVVCFGGLLFCEISMVF